MKSAPGKIPDVCALARDLAANRRIELLSMARADVVFRIIPVGRRGAKKNLSPRTALDLSYVHSHPRGAHLEAS